MNQLTKDDQAILEILVDSFIYNKGVSLDLNFSFVFLKFEISNLMIYVFAEKDAKDKFKFINFFDISKEEYFKNKYKDNMIFTSQYISLNKNELISISNISLENIFKSIIKSEINKLFLDKLELLIFEMITAYAESKNDNVFNTCEDFFVWLSKIDSSQKKSTLLIGFNYLK